MQWLRKKEASAVDAFDHIQMKSEVIAFTFEKLPRIYKDLLLLTNEISLIDREIERLEGIAKEFPDQLKMINVEKRMWEKTRQRLLNALVKSARAIEALYVAYRVNPPKGIEKINAEKDSLKGEIDDTLESVETLVERLKTHTVKKKTFIDRIKDPVLKMMNS